MIKLDNYEFAYDPYPYAVIKNVFSEDDHKKIIEEFPSHSKYFQDVVSKNKNEKKFLKKNFNNTKIQINNLNTFLAKSLIYSKFYNYISSNKFIEDIDIFLKYNHIDLRLSERINKKYFKFFKKKNINTYFEFSSISVDGGFILPHTDSPKKIITCIFSIINDERINSYTGIETDILTTNENKYKYNFYNKTVPKKNTQLVKKVPFESNQMMVFIKTHNSLHSVGPVFPKDNNLDRNFFRNTLTVCLEIEN